MCLAALDTSAIPPWVLVALALFVAWRVSKGGGGAAVTELTAANTVLEKRLHEVGAEIRDLKVENAQLRTRTDFEASMALAVAPLAAGLTAHEQGAATRSEALLKILDERLPHNNHDAQTRGTP